MNELVVHKYCDGAYFLSGERLQALFHFGKRALAELSAEQIVADSLVVRKFGDDFLGRDQKVGRYDEILMIDHFFACIVQLVI